MWDVWDEEMAMYLSLVMYLCTYKNLCTYGQESGAGEKDSGGDFVALEEDNIDVEEHLHQLCEASCCQ